MKNRKFSIFRVLVIIAYLFCIALWVWRFIETRDTDCIVIICLWIALITSELCYWNQNKTLKSAFETEDTLFKVIEDNHKSDLEMLKKIRDVLKSGNKKAIDELIENLDRVIGDIEDVLKLYESIGEEDNNDKSKQD